MSFQSCNRMQKSRGEEKAMSKKPKRQKKDVEPVIAKSARLQEGFEAVAASGDESATGLGVDEQGSYVSMPQGWPKPWESAPGQSKRRMPHPPAE